MSIACPIDAVPIAPGQAIQAAINASPAGTTFCLHSGVHQVPAPITPRSDTSLLGEFGAVLDGTGMSFTAAYEGIITAHNRNIDNVAIRNLVIRNSAQRGIHAFKDSTDGWIVDHNEISNNLVGVTIGNDSVVSSNLIHHNIGDPTSHDLTKQGGGYGAYAAHDVLFLNNEIAFNGPEQKIYGGIRITFRGNFVHHNYANGIWYDTDCTGSLVENNIITDNGGIGINYEIAGHGILRSNLIVQNGSDGIFISTSKDTEVYGNRLRGNADGIRLWYHGPSVGGGVIGFDLTNNDIHHNTLVNTGPTGFASNVPPSLYGAANRFEGNVYDVVDRSDRWWWAGKRRTWSQWQALGHDLRGRVVSRRRDLSS